MRDIRGNRFIGLVWRSHVAAHPDWHQHGSLKPRETAVTKYRNERVNSPLKELKH